MAGRTLTATIVIAGKQAASFKQLGAALADLGNTIDPVSQKLIEFGKEGVQTYAGYEDAMLEAQVALRTQYETTSELAKAMVQLDEAARSWAASSRFTTEDVAVAISNAAHAGWNLEQILTGVPVAMNASLAGGMELATGLEYLVDITNASRLSFDEMADFADIWVYAANRASTTVPEMGEAFQKMGSTLQFFKGDMAAAATMLSILANTGTKGTEAGTLLRNSMIRIIAPTKKAAEEMEGLSLTEQELIEAYSNTEGLEEANRLLAEAGFSAYNSQGKLKSFIDIFRDLSRATSNMTEQERNRVLSAIFPTRTITGALAFVEAAANGTLDALYASIKNRSEGYTEYAADVMESGLGGSLRALQAAWDVLKLNAGGALKDEVGWWADKLTGIVNGFNSMDSGKFSALVSGLEAIALAGPGLKVAGAALKFLGSMTWGKAAMLGALAITSAAAAFNDLYNTAYKDRFGDLTLDESVIGGYLSSLGEAFSGSSEKINSYKTALDQAVESYNTASSTLSGKLVEAMLTNKTLTAQDINELSSLGDQMRNAVLAGLDGSYSAKNYTLLDLAGVEEYTDLDEDGVWSQMFSILNLGYEDAVEDAQKIGQGLRDAMTSAFEDGKLTEEETANIQSWMDSYNALVAKELDRQNFLEQQRLMRKAQRLGVEGYDKIVEEALELRDSQWELKQTDLDEELYDLMLFYDEHMGEMVNGELITPESKQAAYDAWTQSSERKMAAFYQAYNETLFKLNEQMIKGSDFEEEWELLKNAADSYLQTGIVDNEAFNAFNDAFGMDAWKKKQMIGFLMNAAEDLGGYDMLIEQAAYAAERGDIAGANRYSQMAAIYELLNGGPILTAAYGGYGAQLYTKDNAELAGVKHDLEMLFMSGEANYAQTAWDTLTNDMLTGSRNFAGYVETLKSSGLSTGLEGIISQLGEIVDLSTVQIPAGFEGVSDYAAAFMLLSGQEFKVQMTPEVNTDGLSDQVGEVEIQGNIVTDGMEDGQEAQEVQVALTADASGLDAEITTRDGMPITVNVGGDTSGLASAIDAQDGRGITVTVHGFYAGTTGVPRGRYFAEGGRADEPSIFGEAGPEWAIPEEHSERTATLLNLARQASGFTWDELLSRNGGLNAGGREPTTIVYSPTIHAHDATGVEQKLIEDKARFERMLRDIRLRDEVEVYA